MLLSAWKIPTVNQDIPNQGQLNQLFSSTSYLYYQIQRSSSPNQIRLTHDMSEQQEAWRRYLADHKVFSNPFKQRNWQNHRDVFHAAYDFKPRGSMMKFILATSKTNTIKEMFVNSISVTPRTKDNQAVKVISCLPGGGKSRLLQELSNILDNCGLDAVYLATFDRPSFLCREDAMDLDDNAYASRAIAMRLLFQAIRISDEGARKSSLEYSQWLSTLKDLNLTPIDDIHDAIRLVGGDPMKRCVIAVDEVNKLLEETSHMKKGISTAMEAEVSAKAMEQLIKALGGAMMGNSLAVSFMAGTLISTFAEAALRSGFQMEATILAPLVYAHQSKILDNLPDLRGWRRSQTFKDILAELGGVPRLLEWFIDKVHKSLTPGNGWEGVDWRSIRMSLTGGLNLSRYMWRSRSHNVAQTLVDDIILRRVLESPSLQVVPSSDDKDTYESLQQTGQILLEEQDLGFCVTMPLMTFRGLVAAAVNNNDPSARRYSKVQRLLVADVNGWQSLEEFGYCHSAMLNEFFAHHSDYSEHFTLAQRYAPGLGGGGQVSVKLINRTPDHVAWGVRFPEQGGETKPITHTAELRHFADGNCYLNGVQAPCWDAWYVCDQVGHRMTHAASQVLVAEQYKRYNPLLSSKLSFNDCRKEHLKNLKAWNNANIEGKQDYRVVTVVIACSHITPPKDGIDQDKDLLVVDNKGLADLYGILRPLLKVARYGHYDINTMGDEELRKFFGKMGPAVVRLRGPDGFESPDDLYRRLDADGVQVDDFEKVNGMEF